MSVSKDEAAGTWTIYSRYTNWQNKTKVLHKRGFKTKREALEYERKFLLQKSKNLNMGFTEFVETYFDDIGPRIKYNTRLTKEHAFRTKIIPYFEDKALSDITPTDVIQWQNTILQMEDEEGKRYQPTYLRSISAQLSALFNHAVRYYGLKDNSVKIAGFMGSSKAKEMLFWTREEYQTFKEAMKEKPVSYYAFEILYWCGIRCGELLALTKGDFDLEKKTLTINKSLQHLKGEIYVTDPKTQKSNRVIDLPDFLCDEMEDYFSMLYRCDDDTRLFNISKSYLHHEMYRGVRETGVKRIRIHDLRHSHVAHLIELGFSPVEIADRLGHESMSVTMTYSHLYPSKQRKMADKLNQDYKRMEE